MRKEQNSRDNENNRLELDVRYIDPHVATDFDLRRMIAEAIFSPSSQTVILYRYPEFENAITPNDLTKVAEKSLYDKTQFINEKAIELIFPNK